MPCEQGKQKERRDQTQHWNMMKTIEILISPDGQINIEAVGFQGADCEQATAFLEKSLGKLNKRTRKPDYYCRNIPRQIQRIGE